MNSELLTAWQKSTLESNKLIMQLSGGGLALLVVLARSGGIDSARLLVVYCIGISGFALAVFTTFIIINLGIAKVERDLFGGGVATPNKPMWASVMQSMSFMLSVLCVAAIGVEMTAKSFCFYAS